MLKDFVKILNFNFCQKMGVVLKILDNKLHDTKGILISNRKRKTYKYAYIY